MSRVRLVWVDMARGLSLAAMVVYHLIWDLGFFQLIDPFIPARPGFKLFGHSIATAFLALAGVSLVLAWRQANPWPGYWRRLVTIVAAAAAVTLASFWFSPDSMIYFGILHCIALSSLLALPFVAAPVWMVALASAGLLTLPALVALPQLDAPALSWLGLGTAYPISEDFRPLLPWSGMLLLGIFMARIWPHMGRGRALAPPRRFGWLVWMGRHSLLIYLIHQPILIGTASVLASYEQPQQISFEEDFDNQCRIECMAGGAKAGFCTQTCGCVTLALKKEPLWSAVQRGRLSPPQQERLEALIEICKKLTP